MKDGENLTKGKMIDSFLIYDSESHNMKKVNERAKAFVGALLEECKKRH